MSHVGQHATAMEFSTPTGSKTNVRSNRSAVGDANHEDLEAGAHGPAQKIPSHQSRSRLGSVHPPAGCLGSATLPSQHDGGAAAIRRRERARLSAANGSEAPVTAHTASPRRGPRTGSNRQHGPPSGGRKALEADIAST